MIHSVVTSVLTLALTLALCAGTAKASVADGPAKTLETAVNQILGILKDPSLSGPANAGSRRDKLLSAISGVFDKAELSRRAVAKDWDKFSPDEKERFTSEFANLLERTYMDRIESYTDQRVEYLGENSLAEDRAEVSTKIISKTAEIPVIYRMIKKDGWRVYDVVIEGVSLVQNYRNQFGQILLKETPEQLIGRIKTMNSPGAGKK